MLALSSGDNGRGGLIVHWRGKVRDGEIGVFENSWIGGEEADGDQNSWRMIFSKVAQQLIDRVLHAGSGVDRELALKGVDRDGVLRIERTDVLAEERG